MIASSLTGTQGIVALAALAVAATALIACALLARSLRQLRSAQRLVLGDGGARDVVAHSASLQQAFEALQSYVGDVGQRLDERLDEIDQRLAGAISRRSLVRYDAYNELSGQQSMSIALLDEHGSGVVLSCIHHRDQARLYAKQVLRGSSELEFSPEELQAVSTALAGPPAAIATADAPGG
ncbi:MAG TPA: DUF4446 family protein [Solirubrobacteraceae bacterium]|nr:DUF4446 family protein [Solirubrobacteraceae bacterium]